MYFLCCACGFIHCFPVPFINEHKVEVNVLCSKQITALMMEDTESLELFPLCLFLSFFYIHSAFALPTHCPLFSSEDEKPKEVRAESESKLSQFENKPNKLTHSSYNLQGDFCYHLSTKSLPLPAQRGHAGGQRREDGRTEGSAFWNLTVYCFPSWL